MRDYPYALNRMPLFRGRMIIAGRLTVAEAAAVVASVRGYFRA